MPLPAAMSQGTGRLVIDGGFRVAVTGYREARLDRAVERLVARLSRQTGIPMPGGNGEPALVIECQGPGEKVQTSREVESYTLEVTGKQAKIAAQTPVGALRGIETFLQLVMPDASGFAAPAVRIDDKPRFPWRGLMIDSARHFLPVDVIERNLDGMAAVKLNVFHWHLSDNQGFRVESKRFPKLHELGSDGLYYTQDQIRHVIAYAQDRGIRVIPEFDMPGHATSWFVGYPQLASGPGPYRIARDWGVQDPAIDPSRDEVYEFLDEFIGEMAALFPDEYFHVGGDEVNGKQWNANAKIQEFKRAHDLKTNGDLQTWFETRVIAIVGKHGKKAIGWDEVLHPGVPKDIVVHSWRGQKSLAAAVRQGYQGILSYGYYLDLMYPASSHYGIDPMAGDAASLNAAEKERILGGEACEWTEMADSGNVEARIWPRAAAVAERLWSPQSTTDRESMYRRMEVESGRLTWLGLQHETSRLMMLERIAGYRPAGAAAVLSTALEPVKEYARHNRSQGRGEDYTQFTPLNRMVDATPAESVSARRFSLAVDALLAGDRSKSAEVRRDAVLWRDQYGQLKQAFAESFLAAEVQAISQDVSALGAAAIQALDYRASGKAAPRSWVAAQKSLFERVKKPRAELLVVILSPVEKLVKAAGGAR